MPTVGDWPGCWNCREILPGVWRASALDQVDWRAPWAAGVRTIVDLRNEGGTGGPCRRVHAPLELGLESDPRFVALQEQTGLASPSYYLTFCKLWRGRVAAAVSAIDAAERGVVFNCQAGWDRTGMLAAILLKREGLSFDEIVADYALSWENPDPDESAALRLAKLESQGLTWEQALRAFLASEVSTF